MGKSVLIILLSTIALFGLITLIVFKSLGTAQKNTIENYNINYVRNLNNSVLDILLSKLADSTNYRTQDEENLSILEGISYYSIKDTSFGNDSLIQIRIRSKFNNTTKELIAYVQTTGGFVPPVLRGTITANANLNKTISDMIIDGRDHDINGKVIPSKGIYGVSSGTDFVNLQNAKIGGTKDGIDYPPSFPHNPSVIEENYDWGGSFPNSPDKILGFPEGTLKSIAQSGINGSQYVTNLSQLKFPLKGITYLELPPGDYKLNLGGFNNEGILVVHNPSLSTRITKLKANKPFKGLIIGDYMFHLHLNILGGLILLSPNLEMSKECKGNNDHWIYYSSAAIKNATFFASQYSNTNYYGTKRNLSIVYLYE